MTDQEAEAQQQREQQMLRADLIAVIEMQFVMEEFLRTRVGTYLVRRADVEKRLALEELVKADLNTPDGLAAAKKLQFQIGVTDVWQIWIDQAIGAGKNAQDELVALEQT